MELIANKVKSIDIKSSISISFLESSLTLGIVSKSSTDGFYIKSVFGYEEKNITTNQIKDILKNKKNGSLKNKASTLLEEEISKNPN